MIDLRALNRRRVLHNVAALVALTASRPLVSEAAETSRRDARIRSCFTTVSVNVGRSPKRDFRMWSPSRPEGRIPH